MVMNISPVPGNMPLRSPVNIILGIKSIIKDFQIQQL